MESSGFSVICLLHSVIAVSCGALIMFFPNEISVFGHCIETTKLLGSTPHDQLLIQISDSFAGLLRVVIGFYCSWFHLLRDRASMLKSVFFFIFQWLFGGFPLREGLKIWLMRGQDS